MLSEKALHEAEAFVYDKVHTETFQMHDDWFNWAYEGTEYDINIFTDFHTRKIGATIYPLKKNKATDTLKGVRIL